MLLLVGEDVGIEIVEVFGCRLFCGVARWSLMFARVIVLLVVLFVLFVLYVFGLDGGGE